MNMTLIEKEWNAAQHLLFVSLKYTKTGDVMLNLIQRWQHMVEAASEELLTKAKKKKLIKEIPATPKEKVDILQKLFKKEKVVMDTLILYSFFRRIPALQQVKEHEFRKNVALRIIDQQEIVIDMEKLKEWALLLENFKKFVRSYIA